MCSSTARARRIFATPVRDQLRRSKFLPNAGLVGSVLIPRHGLDLTEAPAWVASKEFLIGDCNGIRG